MTKQNKQKRRRKKKKKWVFPFRIKHQSLTGLPPIWVLINSDAVKLTTMSNHDSLGQFLGLILFLIFLYVYLVSIEPGWEGQKERKMDTWRGRGATQAASP